MKTVTELNKDEILLFCSNDSARQRIIVFNKETNELRDFDDKVLIPATSNIYEVAVAGPLVYIFTV